MKLLFIHKIRVKFTISGNKTLILKTVMFASEVAVIRSSWIKINMQQQTKLEIDPIDFKNRIADVKLKILTGFPDACDTNTAPRS